ncbi:MAG: DUF4214 domain-containing protein [Telluria sp.]
MKKNRAAAMALLLAVSGCGGSNNEAPIRLLAQSTQVSPASTALVHGYFANYTITRSADGTVTLFNQRDRSTETFAPSLQSIGFADEVVSFDVAGMPGQVYRLYQAAFNRQPDLAGLGFWMHVLRQGSSMEAVAKYFYQSPEFQSAYGSVSDERFVTLIYNNVLHREPEAEGREFWLQQMKNGLSRERTLLYFSESPENVSNTAAATRNGIRYLPDPAERKTIPVQKSSYLNAKNVGLTAQTLPVADPTFTHTIQAGFAFADFFQDGALSMVAFTELPPADGSWPPTVVGAVHFYRKDSAGAWIDNTASLLTDTAGCILPRKVVVSDFNNDGLPDVFAACSGVDVAPYSGENYRVLLSQPGKGYKNVLLPFSGYAHGASAADVDGDGNADIVVAAMGAQGGKTPLYFLMGDGKGGFSVDYSRADRPEFQYKMAFWTVELIPDQTGKQFRLFAGGTESYVTPSGQPNGGTPTILIAGDNAGRFDSGVKTILPAAKGFETVMDVIVKDQAVYVLRVLSEPSYGGTAIQKIDLATGSDSLIYSHIGWYPGRYLKYPAQWFPWMVPTDGHIESLNGYFAVRVPM